MANLSDALVKKILIDSRLDSNPSQETIAVYENEFEATVNDFIHLQQASVSTTDLLKRTTNFLTLEQLREDLPVVKDESYSKLKQLILQNSPNSKNNFFIVDGIFE